MTCLECFWKEHPELTPKGKCPHEFGYLPERPWDCYEVSCFDDCWMRETMTNTTEQKEED